MITKLRRDMIAIFLFFTMLSYTVLLLALAANTVLKEQEAELTYAENIADSIVRQIQQGVPLTKQDCIAYAEKFQTWSITHSSSCLLPFRASNSMDVPDGA